MAKRRTTQSKTPKKRLDLLYKIGFGVVIVICLLFGYTNGYPLIAEGKIWQGILTGLGYGGGAFLAIAVSIFINRKLKGL